MYSRYANHTWDTYRHTALKQKKKRKKSVFKMSLEVEVALYTRFFHADAVAFSVIDDFCIVNLVSDHVYTDTYIYNTRAKLFV